jgi:hypothetical protein
MSGKVSLPVLPCDGGGAVRGTSGSNSHDTTFNAGTCPVDRRPCEVLGLLAPELARLADREATAEGVSREVYYRRALGRVWGLLPCDRCRRAEADAARLPRLGKHERRLLLGAPPPGEEARVIEPPGVGRSADEANRRAARKLWRRGLLVAFNSPVKVEVQDMRLWIPYRRGLRQKMTRTVTVKKLAVTLSPLGAAVVRQLGDSIREGKPVRWARHRGAILAAARLSATELLERFLAGVEHDREWAQRMIEMCRRGRGRRLPLEEQAWDCLMACTLFLLAAGRRL